MTPSKIMIVEDEYIIAGHIQMSLEKMGYTTCPLVSSAEEALENIEVEKPDLVLMDIMLKGEKDGIEAANHIKSHYNIPVVYLTAYADEEILKRAKVTEPFGFLIKPFQYKELYSTIEMALHKHQADQDMKAANQLLKELSVRDELTGLYNRRHMSEIFEQEFYRAERYKTDLSCILFDLDFFKEINDTYGHAFGDHVICEFSACLKRLSRHPDFIFRYGGEEFLTLLPHTDITGARIAAEKICSSWENKTHSDGVQSATVTVSAGLASLRLHRPADWKQMVTFADKALYRAKAGGRNRVRIHMEDSFEFPGDTGDTEDKDIRLFKEKLSFILEKTKKASLENLELLVREVGGESFLDHNRKVEKYLKVLCNKLNLSPNIVQTIKQASSIHDCFKVLFKKTLMSTSKVLNSKEKAEIEKSPYVLAEMTRLFDFFSNERTVLLWHHENFDGTGYPEGLNGGQIPTAARIFSIADALAAMLSDKPFRKRLSHDMAIEQLAVNAGTQFDPALVLLLLDTIETERLLDVSDRVLESAKNTVNKVIAGKD